MSRKPRAIGAIQPPQLAALDLSEPDSDIILSSRASHTRQHWTGLRFDGQNAEDLAFEQLSVRGVSFQSCELPLLQIADCRFDTSDFAGCSLDKAYLRRVELLGCRLVGLKLLDADLEDVLFSRCNGQMARVWTSVCRSVRFEHCSLREASFDGSNLSGTVFHKCDLTGADFRNTTLKGADLRGSTLAGLRIHGKELVGAIIDPAQALELIQVFGVRVRPEDV